MSDLKKEIKQTTDFSSLEEEAILNVLRTSDRMHIEFTRLFRPYGVTQPQYNVLRILRGAKSPLPCLEVADRLVTVVPAITGLLDRLEQAGHVTRRRSDTDRRVVLVEITKSGLGLLKSLDKPVESLDRGMLGHLTERELKQLIRLMGKARSGLSSESELERV